MSSHQHQPVLLEEVKALLPVRPEGLYIDGTFGRGGHSRAVLAALGEQGRMIAFDRDPQAVEQGQLLAQQDARFSIVHDSFSSLQNWCDRQGVTGKVNGILLDIGVSSPQLDDPERGFSFNREGPLDMRMNPEVGQSAAQWLAQAEQQEIADVLWRFGEEKASRRIARRICERREESPIETTSQLANLVAGVVRSKEKGKHPATRTFQAIRIHINRELEELEEVLDQAINVLAPEGRLLVISFHSLEDRMVKRKFRDESGRAPVNRHLPEPQVDVRLKLLGKARKPTEQEIAQNPRARSSVLRVAERVKEPGICE